MGIFNFFGCKEKSDQSNDEEIKRKTDQILNEFMNRKIYKQLSKEIIEQTSDENLIQTIYDNIETHFSENELYKSENIKKLSKGQQAIFSIWVLEAEVNNGGFNQLYFNWDYAYAQMAYEGLKYIKADKFAELVKKANQTYIEIKETLDQQNDGTIEGFMNSYEDNPLNKFDEEFYELYKNENLHNIQIKYIRKNYSEFVK